MSRNRFGALVILGFSIAYGIIALNLPEIPAFSDSVSPSSLPISLSATGIVISILILLLPAESVTALQNSRQKVYFVLVSYCC